MKYSPVSVTWALIMPRDTVLKGRACSTLCEKGTDHFIPYDEVGQHLASFPARRSTPIYLYCKSGRMVNVSARTLFEHGYTNVYNLGGGTQAWLEAGFTGEE
jgi:hypothetical protein